MSADLGQGRRRRPNPAAWERWVHSPKVGRTGREPKTRPQPMRMCVGCRVRASKSELLRVVVVRDADTVRVVPDPSGSAPGRGAHVHPRRDCLGQAERRRAFPRALRIEGPVDVADIRRHIEALDAVTHRQTDSDRARPATPAGPPRKQEVGRAAHEHSMRTER
ncbi:MAG TPA: YlxR family protein [Actinopolymorphaceae bacterium]